ncbi:hypothetical protein AYI69_g10971 [Smittium culicis]|uniref:Uncharacterized protein n=1 Tax=Smittium culicis TaxID=133412 RepID=A0A1R1X260_9FUNG|nr:hypothetical protein AYI69_g10971 [Smittium culicis]
MSFGISKCGALAVGGSFEHPDILELQVQRVPIVKEYWYLGVLINDELDLLKFCRHKVEKAEACYTNIRRLLSSKSVPMASRVLFLRGVLEARMRYGGEILGMYRDRSRSLQRVLNNGLKNFIGVSERATIVKMGNLWLEFEVPPLYASFGYARARAYQKFQDVSTPIALLLKDRSNGPWGKVSNGWLNRMGLEGKSKDDFLSTLTMNQAKFSLGSFYIKYEFQKSNRYWKIGSKYSSYSVGLTWYAAWRCGGIWNSYLAHKVGRGNDDIKCKCPLCRLHSTNSQSESPGLKTLSDNLYQRLDLYTESMGIYLLGGNPGGHPRTTQMGAEDFEIVLTVSKFLQLAMPTYTAKLLGHVKSSLKTQVLRIRFESVPVIRMLVDLWYASRVVLSEH